MGFETIESARNCTVPYFRTIKRKEENLNAHGIGTEGPIKHTAHVELENWHLAADVFANAFPPVAALAVPLEVNHVVARRPVVVLVKLELVATQAC